MSLRVFLSIVETANDINQDLLAVVDLFEEVKQSLVILSEGSYLSCVVRYKLIKLGAVGSQSLDRPGI